MANEKRLIDANELVNHIDLCVGKSKDLISSVCIAIKCYVEQMPTVEAVEVVRCKDCKHLKYGYQCYYPLGMMLNNDGDAYVLVDPDKDFCSCGERREGE